MVADESTMREAKKTVKINTLYAYAHFHINLIVVHGGIFISCLSSIHLARSTQLSHANENVWRFFSFFFFDVPGRFQLFFLQCSFD